MWAHKKQPLRPRAHAHACTHTHTRGGSGGKTHTYTRTHAHAHTHAHIHINAQTHIRTHTHTHRTPKTKPLTLNTEGRPRRNRKREREGGTENGEVRVWEGGREGGGRERGAHAHTLAAGARSATRNAHTRTHLPQLAVDHDLLHLAFGAQLHVPVARDHGRANVAAHGRVRTHHLLSRAAPDTFRGRTHARG